MENYLLLLYVTLSQENAIRELFQKRGWHFQQTDLQNVVRNKTDVNFQSKHGDSSSVQCQKEMGVQPELALFPYGEGEAENTHSVLKDGYSQNDTRKCSQKEPNHSQEYASHSQKEPNHSQSEISSIKCGHSLGNHSDGMCRHRSSHNHCENDDTILDLFQTSHVYSLDERDDTRATSVESISTFNLEINGDESGRHVGTLSNHESSESHVTHGEDISSREITLSNTDTNVGHVTHGVDRSTLVDTDEREGITHVKINLSKEQRVVQNGEEKNTNSKSELKLKIEQGKRAFLEKRKKRQEEQSKNNKAKQLNKKGKKNIQDKSSMTKKQPIHCVDCDMTFTSLKRFEGHKAKNGGQCVFPCEYCDKVFKYRKSKYLLHIRSAHTKERPHVCNVCGKGYVTSDKLKIHLRMHTGDKPCVCEQCGKSFYSRADLSIHKEYHHLSRENQDEMHCDICNVTFCSKRYLLYHKKVTHSDQRDFLCNKCEKRFKCNSALQRHLKFMHTENRDYVCTTCDKSFKSPACLKKHNVRHGGDRNFLCSYCDKGFYEKAKLLQHERVHTGEKPYRCDTCGFRCALSGNLTKHKKTHRT